VQELQTIIDTINQVFETKSAVRDRTLSRSRELIRHCANSIRATHRGDDEQARTLLDTARKAAAEMLDEAQRYSDVYWAGYTQDSLKELAEAYLTRAIILEEPLPSPESISVEYAAYLNGLAEAAGELRRFALDALRRGDVSLAEKILGHMDDIYSMLVTVDFPSAITGNLKRSTDMVRGVLERTRGDVTTAVRQETMKSVLGEFEKRIGMPKNDRAVFEPNNEYNAAEPAPDPGE